MSRKQTTTYVCDCCGKAMESPGITIATFGETASKTYLVSPAADSTFKLKDADFCNMNCFSHYIAKQLFTAEASPEKGS